MTAGMQHNQHHIKEQEKIVNEESQKLAKDDARISAKQQNAEIAYRQAKPMLGATDKAVAKTKTPLRKPSKRANYTIFYHALASAVEALLILLQKPAGTAVAKVEMRNPRFCRNPQRFAEGGCLRTDAEAIATLDDKPRPESG
jgi:hypothetical protein